MFFLCLHGFNVSIKCVLCVFFAWPLQVFWGEKTCIMCHPETHKNFGNERWGKKGSQQRAKLRERHGGHRGHRYIHSFENTMTICQHADISSSQFVEAWLFTRNMTLYFSITGSGRLKKASGWETIGTGYFMYMIYVTMTPWRTVIQGLTELRPPTIWGQDFHALRCPTKIGFASTFRSPIIYKLLHIITY